MEPVTMLLACLSSPVQEADARPSVVVSCVVTRVGGRLPPKKKGGSEAALLNGWGLYTPCSD